jgi:hypothetical protein
VTPRSGEITHIFGAAFTDQAKRFRAGTVGNLEASMKRVLFLVTTISAAVVSGAVMAQTARAPAAVDRVPAAVDRTAALPNIDTIAQRLRSSGVAEDVIAANIERIRAAIQSGKYPHLARRIYNATHPDDSGRVDPARRRANAANPTADRTPTDVTTFDRTARTLTVTPSAVNRVTPRAVPQR